MPRKRSKIQERAELNALRLLLGTLGSFSLKRSMRIGRAISLAAIKAFPKLTRTAKRNLEIAYPQITETERDRLVKGTFESLGRHLGFISHFNKFEPEDIRNLIEVQGKENLDAVYGKGRGVIFITGHFGSWEVFNLLPPAFGYDINILVRRIDNPSVEKYVDSFRTRFGSVTLDKRRAARKLFRLLRQGKIIGILADLNVQLKEGVFVDFFGKKANTTTSIAKLAVKTNAAIIPSFAVWEEAKQKYVVYIEPEIEYEKTADSSQEVFEITQEVTRIVEKYVRKYPEQWLWIHKRWNTRPKGEPSLY